jgi:hypothetical protein
MSQMKIICYEKIGHDHVQENPDLYNTNNHWTFPPNNYHNVLDKSNTKYWINQMMENYHVIHVDSQNLKWIKKAL